MKRIIIFLCLLWEFMGVSAQGIYVYKSYDRQCLKSAEFDSIVVSMGDCLYEVYKTDGTTLRLPATEVDSLVAFGSEYPNPVHEYVDLGLSVMWAACNVGADRPEDYGSYFAWGETAEKSKYYNENSVTYSVGYSDLQSQGIIDADGNLTSGYDAATANWGGGWRMPTIDEVRELLDNCTWTWTAQNEVNGYKVTGPNGNSIFVPAAGNRNGASLVNAGSDGICWSATAVSDSYYSYYLTFNSGRTVWYYYYRYYGRSVRPVLEL